MPFLVLTLTSFVLLLVFLVICSMCANLLSGVPATIFVSVMFVLMQLLLLFRSRLVSSSTFPCFFGGSSLLVVNVIFIVSGVHVELWLLLLLVNLLSVCSFTCLWLCLPGVLTLLVLSRFVLCLCLFGYVFCLVSFFFVCVCLRSCFCIGFWVGLVIFRWR